MWENYVSAPTACSGQRRKGEEGERGKMCISRPLAIFYEPGRSFLRKSSSENICLGVKFGRGWYGWGGRAERWKINGGKKEMCEGGKNWWREGRDQKRAEPPQVRRAMVGGGGPEQVGRSRTEGTPRSVSLQARTAKPGVSELRRWQGPGAVPLPTAAAFLRGGSPSFVSRPGFSRQGRQELEGCEFSPSPSAAVLIPGFLPLWQISEGVAGSSQWGAECRVRCD